MQVALNRRALGGAALIRRASRCLASRPRLLCTAVQHAPILTAAADVHPPFARYVHACEVPSSTNLIFTSGQLGITPDGTIPEGAEAQTALCFQNIKAVLAAAGADLKHVVRLNAYVTGREHLPGYMKARDKALGELPPTASTLMMVSGFAKPEFVVEVEAMAAIARPAGASSAAAASVASAASGRRGLHTGRPRHTRALHGERVAASAVAAFTEELKGAGVQVMSASDGKNEEREIKRRSRDFYWYSPILKRTLDGRIADCLVLAKTEADVLAASEIALKHGVPLTARGAGTGNYGQAMPIRGGAVLDLSGLDEIIHIDAEAGTVKAGAGAKMEDVEEAARKHGWELRQHPSTRRTASIGGFVAGGSTGHGALLHGGLSEDGAVLSLRVVTAEAPSPRVLELKGRDVFPVVHAYGTNGIITAVELPLARAQPWTDVTATFASLMEASAFALDVANTPSIVKRAVTVLEAPISHKYLDADKLMHGQKVKDGEQQHVCLVQCSPPGVDSVARLAGERSGQITRTVGAKDAPFPFFEFGWNHTTLHALKHDKTTTYLQSVMEPDNALELVKLVQDTFGPTRELAQHLEVVNFGGRASFASLALLWPSGEIGSMEREERLKEILSWHEANGMPVFDPHTHILEDGGMKQTDWAQLGFKRKVDPNGILNPGKMRAWEEGAATTEASDPRGAFAAAYRLADTSSLEDGPTSAAFSSPAMPSNPMPTTTAPPKKVRSRLWGEWSTADFAEADLTNAVAILPLGATEAHGPHLPLGVDAMHNADLLGRALKRLPADTTILALPPLDIGVSCEHSGFAGTLEMSAETATAAWTDIGACVRRAGFRKLVLYNSHGGNQALAEVVARRLRLDHGMLTVLAMNLAQGMTPGSEISAMFPEDEVRYGIHGGAIETSIMLHLRPQLVSTEAAKDFASKAAEQPKSAQLQMHQLGFSNKTGWMSQDLNPHGVVGAAATLSCAEKGAQLTEACVDGLAKLLVEVYEADVDEWLGTEPLHPSQGPPVFGRKR